MELEEPLPQLSELMPIALAKAEAMVFRVPIEHPVITSFGTMHSRPAVVIRLEDAEGTVGWGEAWCNFPSVGAEHRARVFASAVAPLLLERKWSSPQQAFQMLSQRLHVLALQCGEPGTVAQIIAGADIALWDLIGKRRELPLWKLLGGTPEVAVYASGINPVEPERLAARKLAEGYRAFKLKIGFGLDRDIANLQALRNLLGPDVPLMVDANQAWDADAALSTAHAIAPYAPAWLEEPLPADAAWADWQRLALGSPIPLAGGENLRGFEEFGHANTSNVFKVIQPDLGKWGGLSGCIPVGQQARAHDKLFCPHWLGGGIGQIASMHLKAAVGGPGYVEVDANDNPLRDILGSPFPEISEGIVTLSSRSGLGIDPDIEQLKRYRASV